MLRCRDRARLWIMQPNSPWRTADFRTLFSATALSQLGTNVSYVAVPLIAVAELDASPGQVGALATLSTLAFLLIGLPAGAWVDRMRHRRVLIAADLARAVLFASVPVAWWLDALTLGQLYAVVLLNGCATVFFDVGSQSTLPGLVGRDALVQANAAMMSLMAVSNVAGRSAGGALVQFLTAPVAVLCTAASHLASALQLTRVRPDQVPPAPVRTVGLRKQIGEGVRHVFGNVELRALALTAALTNLGSQIINTMLPVLFVRELGLPASALGLYWAAGGVGLLLGARCAAPRRAPRIRPHPRRPGPVPRARRTARPAHRSRTLAVARGRRGSARPVQDGRGQRARSEPAPADDRGRAPRPNERDVQVRPHRCPRRRCGRGGADR